MEKCSEIDIRFEPMKNLKKEVINIQVIVQPRILSIDSARHFESFFQKNRVFHLVILDGETSELLCYRKFLSKLEPSTFHVPLSSSNFSGRVLANIICDELVGHDCFLSYPNDEDQISSSNSSPRKRKARQQLLHFPDAKPSRTDGVDSSVVDSLQGSSTPKQPKGKSLCGY